LVIDAIAIHFATAISDNGRKQPESSRLFAWAPQRQKSKNSRVASVESFASLAA